MYFFSVSTVLRWARMLLLWHDCAYNPLIVAFYSLLALLGLFVMNLSAVAFLQILAVVTGAVSAGLLTLITLNYSWGSVRIGQQGGLVQQPSGSSEVRPTPAIACR